MNEHEEHWRSLTGEQRAEKVRELYPAMSPEEARKTAGEVDRGLQARSDREQMRAGREILGDAHGGLFSQMAGRHPLEDIERGPQIRRPQGRREAELEAGQ